MRVIGRAVVIGMAVALAGTLPRDLLFKANLHYWPAFPWGTPIVAVYIWFFWRYLNGAGESDSTKAERRAGFRANSVSRPAWVWSLLTGAFGIAAFVLALRLANRLIVLPPQSLHDLPQVPESTMLSWLLMSAPVAGIVEEAAFRGYMQGPIERRYGLVVAILITGTFFAIAHLDFTPILWPYYVAVAAIYGTVTYRTNSIMPAIVLHAAANLYSNLDLWLYGHAEWQAAAGPSVLIWKSGVDPSLVSWSFALVGVGAAAAGAYLMLVRATPEQGRAFARSV